jgi:hypothetical protein
MKHSTIYAGALILGSAGTVVTMIFHPTGGDLLHRNRELAERGEMMAVATHALALFSVPLLFYGFLGLYRCFGKNSPLATAALTAWLFGAFAVICAGAFSGLIAPNVTRQMAGADEATGKILGELLHYNYLINQGFTKIFVVASSVSVILWSALFLKTGGRLTKITGVTGCVIAGVSLIAFFAGHLRLDVHGFGLFVFAQTIWIILAGILLFRADDPA